MQKCKGPEGRMNSVGLKEKQASSQSVNLSMSSPGKNVAEWKILDQRQRKGQNSVEL